MPDAMVTGRMPANKKDKGNSVLKRMGLTASEAINLLYDRLISEQNAEFLQPTFQPPSPADWKAAFGFVDSLSEPAQTEFDDMTMAEARTHRLKAQGAL